MLVLGAIHSLVLNCLPNENSTRRRNCHFPIQPSASDPSEYLDLQTERIQWTMESKLHSHIRTKCYFFVNCSFRATNIYQWQNHLGEKYRGLKKSAEYTNKNMEAQLERSCCSSRIIASNSLHGSKVDWGWRLPLIVLCAHVELLTPGWCYLLFLIRNFSVSRYITIENIRWEAFGTRMANM